MRRHHFAVLLPLLALLALAGCATQRHVVRSSALEFLYPAGAEPVAASNVTLTVPVRVGLAFVPAATPGGRGFAAEPISEDQRQALLKRIADAFGSRDTIGGIEVIPTTYLAPGGGFANLDRIRSAFGVDLMALVSYEQAQFSSSTGSSVAYLTILGAYVVRGEKNETRTILETVVYDIPSRALLFRAGGSSESSGRSTPVSTERALKQEAEAGFEAATTDLIGQLRKGLDAFEEQARTGTVRGIGTPEVSIVETQTSSAPGGETRAAGGALGGLDLAILAAAVIAAGRGGHARRRG
ncbi:MAG TPA: rhombotarget lipoprotein [Candidatus Saccharimonadales bacterium]|nr:rhombotarget lipoprotein [Candidatus Saccharimonadales bacterium]